MLYLFSMENILIPATVHFCFKEQKDLAPQTTSRISQTLQN